MADIENAMNTLSEMLSTDDGKQTLTDMVSSLTDNNSPDLFGGMSMDTVMMLKQAMDEFGRNDDRRSRLLLALKPYLSSSRSGKLDGTINLLKILKLPYIAKSIKRKV